MAYYRDIKNNGDKYRPGPISRPRNGAVLDLDTGLHYLSTKARQNMNTAITSPTTLELRQVADDALTAALDALRAMRDNEMRAARDCSESQNNDGLDRSEQHMRHLMCNRALIEAERLTVDAREMLL